MGSDGIAAGLPAWVAGYRQVNRQNAWDALGFDGTLRDAKSLSLKGNRVFLGGSETPRTNLTHSHSMVAGGLELTS